MSPASINSTRGLSALHTWSVALSAVLFATLLLTMAIVSISEAAEPGQLTSAPQRPALVTNENQIAEALRASGGLQISSPKAVFAYVLASLPGRVMVYPTENYYYFTFLHGGVPYAGNLRLDAMDRDHGKLHFVYFRRQTPWMGTSAVTHMVLGGSQGVEVVKLDQLVYRVKHGMSSVVFELNNLSNLMPPRETLVAGEQYLGPVFDESGIRFFLIYNPRAKIFHYVLDETAPVADRLAPTGISDRISIGMRTGFAFYEDHRAARKLLIGVYEESERLNTQFDGPFDQLPDNFIEGDSLKRAILEVEPDLKNKIGRLGHYHDGATRYMIAPYIRYQELADLAGIHSCATAQTAKSVSYAICFSSNANEAGQ